MAGVLFAFLFYSVILIVIGVVVVINYWAFTRLCCSFCQWYGIVPLCLHNFILLFVNVLQSVTITNAEKKVVVAFNAMHNQVSDNLSFF